MGDNDFDDFTQSVLGIALEGEMKVMREVARSAAKFTAIEFSDAEDPENQGSFHEGKKDLQVGIAMADLLMDSLPDDPRGGFLTGIRNDTGMGVPGYVSYLGAFLQGSKAFYSLSKEDINDMLSVLSIAVSLISQASANGIIAAAREKK